MPTRISIVSALFVAVAISQAFEATAASMTEQVVINDEHLDAAHGWDEIAKGVYQRIDSSDGTVSQVSIGEAGRKYDLGIAKSNLALARQKLGNAIQRGRSAQNLLDEVVELEDAVRRLTPSAGDLLSKGTVNVWDTTTMCHNVYGSFNAGFSTSPRNGGGTVGSATSQMLTASCMSFECNPLEGAYATGFKGGTYASARASNSGGIVNASQSSNGGFVADMYTYPNSTASALTPNVADAACSLRATGTINTTLATTPFQSCYLYKNFVVTKTCAQIP